MPSPSEPYFRQGTRDIQNSTSSHKLELTREIMLGADTSTTPSAFVWAATLKNSLPLKILLYIPAILYMLNSGSPYSKILDILVA
jgi:hypothetical protein